MDPIIIGWKISSGEFKDIFGEILIRLHHLHWKKILIRLHHLHWKKESAADIYYLVEIAFVW